MSDAKTSKRKDYRQHSKGTLLKALNMIFIERYQLAAKEAKRWRRRLYLVAIAAFVAGAGLGLVVAQLLL